jgi:hypothetical protein
VKRVPIIGMNTFRNKFFRIAYGTLNSIQGKEGTSQWRKMENK